jgi:hypothetical protein
MNDVKPFKTLSESELRKRLERLEQFERFEPALV